MNKNTQIIKSCIDELLNLRKKRYDEYIDSLIKQEWALDALNDGSPKLVPHDWDLYIMDDKPTKKNNSQIWEEFVTDFDFPLLKLNNLLEKDFQNREVLEIEKNMAKLHGKKYLNVKEFQEKYGISKNAQAQYRGRMRDPLIGHQINPNGTIKYIVEEVEQWLQNQHK